MEFIFLLFIIVLLDIAALVLARYYVKKKQFRFMTGSLISFALSALVYIKLMAFSVTAVINVLYVAFSSIFVTLFYYVVFKERITTGQWIGILIAFLGVVLMEI